MKNPSRTRSPIRLRARSFMALVLQPEMPFPDWLGELDALAKRSPAFFIGRPVLLDVSGLKIEKPDLTGLIFDLNERGIRVTGIEGAAPDALGLGLPPPLSGGRPVTDLELPGEGSPSAAGRKAAAKADPSLLIDSPVRSGQVIVHREGDVTVLGSVASGAEIIAGGSIHVYGALRGRALAGTAGDPGARIYCRKLDAELLAIDGFYKTAEDLGADLRGKPAQAWLAKDAVMIAGLD